MGVIINEVEMMVDSKDNQTPARQRPPQEAPMPPETAPPDPVAVLEHKKQRHYRILAH